MKKVYAMAALNQELANVTSLPNLKDWPASVGKIYMNYFVNDWLSTVSYLGSAMAAENVDLNEEETAFKKEEKEIKESLNSAVRNIDQEKKSITETIKKEHREIEYHLEKFLNQRKKDAQKSDNTCWSYIKEKLGKNNLNKLNPSVTPFHIYTELVPQYQSCNSFRSTAHSAYYYFEQAKQNISEIENIIKKIPGIISPFTAKSKEKIPLTTWVVLILLLPVLLPLTILLSIIWVLSPYPQKIKKHAEYAVEYAAKAIAKSQIDLSKRLTCEREKAAEKHQELDVRQGNAMFDLDQRLRIKRNNATHDLKSLKARKQRTLLAARQRIFRQKLLERLAHILNHLTEIHRQTLSVNRNILYALPDKVQEDFTYNNNNSCNILIGRYTLPPPVGFNDMKTQALLASLGFSTDKYHNIDFIPLSIPIFWSLNQHRSLAFRQKGPINQKVAKSINASLLRILIQNPPGNAHFLFFDPVGLGRNFAPLLRIADYHERLIGHHVLINRDQIREQMKNMVQRIQHITQKFLRTDFTDIDAYNQDAGDLAESYYFLVIYDFPYHFDEECINELRRILENGPRCGVFAIILQDSTIPMPHGIANDIFGQFCNIYTSDEEGRTTGHNQVIKLETLPDDRIIAKIIERIGKNIQKSLTVKIPYSRLLKKFGVGNKLWTESSIDGVVIPLGFTGLQQVLSLQLGSGLLYFALIVGRPGSGKSNLLHIIITTACRLYSPVELQFYLLDFKSGISFKVYANHELPQARVIAIESDREFGLSILRGLNAELNQRGELFRSCEVDDFEKYRRKTGKRLARILLIMDEFQVLFSREDRISNEARHLMNRLVQQGRAFGLIIILATQSLANAGLERATLDQMTVRIALQCSDADSRLILADDNNAARNLTRPGEAIFNNETGLANGNDFFQVALPSKEDQVKELALIQEEAKRQGFIAEPIIFEGHEPADLEASTIIQEAMKKTSDTVSQRTHLSMWLGEPTALKPPTAAKLKCQSSSSLLVLSKDEEQGLGVILAALISLATQRPPNSLSFNIVNMLSTEENFSSIPEAFRNTVPHHTDIVHRRDLSSLLTNLAVEVKKRTQNDIQNGSTIILAILGLHRARELHLNDRGNYFIDPEDNSTNANMALTTILRDGPEVGIHSIIWCDGLASAERILDRSGIQDIGLRAAGPLSSQDAYQFFDDDVATRIDKPHRMVFYDDDAIGSYEQFRPYKIPGTNWLRQFGKELETLYPPQTTLEDNNNVS